MSVHESKENLFMDAYLTDVVYHTDKKFLNFGRINKRFYQHDKCKGGRHMFSRSRSVERVMNHTN